MPPFELDTASLLVTFRTCVSPGLHAWRVLYGPVFDSYIKFVWYGSALGRVSGTTYQWATVRIVKVGLTSLAKRHERNHKIS